MWNVETKFAVRLGGNTYINTPSLIVFQGEPLFRLRRSDEDGMLGNVNNARGKEFSKWEAALYAIQIGDLTNAQESKVLTRAGSSNTAFGSAVSSNWLK